MFLPVWLILIAILFIPGVLDFIIAAAIFSLGLTLIGGILYLGVVCVALLCSIH